jgi:hypothetical protein
MPEDFYDLLEVPEDASPEQVRRAFREKARVYHPDVNDDERAAAQFKTLREARDVLVDGSERTEYDRLGHDAYVRRRLDGLPMAGLGEEWSRPSGARADADADTDADTDGGRAREGRTGDASSASDGRGTARAGGRASARAGAGTGRVATSRRRRSPSLERAWVAVLVAGVVYAAGVARYQGATDGVADAVASLVGPASGAAVVAPAAFVRGAAAAPSPDLLFPVGVAALPATLGWTVRRFGRGTAWLYVLGSLAPALAVAAGALASAPTPLLVVVGLVALPGVATLAFLGDVGRFVLATRRA